LGQDSAIGCGDDHVDDMIDRHQALHELPERDVIFEHDSGDSKMLIPDGVGQQDRSEFFQGVGHGLASCFDEIPAQGRTSHDEDEAKQKHKLHAEAEDPLNGFWSEVMTCLEV
jgi:hypothetical protein